MKCEGEALVWSRDPRLELAGRLPLAPDPTWVLVWGRGYIPMALSADGMLLAVENSDASVTVYDVASVDMVAGPLRDLVAEGEEQFGVGLTFGTRGEQVLLAMSNLFPPRRVAVWSIAGSASELVALAETAPGANGLGFTPAGDLVLGGTDGSVRIVDPMSPATSGDPLLSLPDRVWSVSFSANGATMAVGTSTFNFNPPEEVVLVDRHSGSELGTLGRGFVPRLSPDGLRLVTSDAGLSGSGAVRIWNLDPAFWRTQACAAAGRNLTRAEWAEFLPGRAYEVTCPEWPSGAAVE